MIGGGEAIAPEPQRCRLVTCQAIAAAVAKVEGGPIAALAGLTPTLGRPVHVGFVARPEGVRSQARLPLALGFAGVARWGCSLGSRAQGDWDGLSDTALLMKAESAELAELAADKLRTALLGDDELAADRHWRVMTWPPRDRPARAPGGDPVVAPPAPPVFQRRPPTGRPRPRRTLPPERSPPRRRHRRLW